MNAIQNYLLEDIGLSTKIKELPNDQLKKLPLYLGYIGHYYILELEGEDFLLVENDDSSHITAGQLKKQAKTLAQYLGLPVIFIVRNQSPQLKRRMIQDRTNFIVPGERIYLPELLISLKENNRQPQHFPEMMTPSSQLLLLYHLQIERLDEYSFKDIAKKLNYTPKTITKIAAELKERNLCEIIGTKEKRFLFSDDKKELWQKAESQMQCPIMKSYFTEKKSNWNFCISGDEALSHYTFLSETNNEDYAVYKIEFEKLKEKDYWKYLDEMEGDVRIEVWKYDPRLLTNDGFIDPLSLYLCYKNDSNERVSAEINELINNKIW